jgi:hypothetical protein
LRLIHTLTEPETLAALPGPAKSVATVDIDWYADVLDIFATHRLKDGEFVSRRSIWGNRDSSQDRDAREGCIRMMDRSLKTVGEGKESIAHEKIL